MKVYKIWCEWDIGQELKVFSSEEGALQEAKSLYEQQDFEEGFEDAFADGYIGVEVMDVL